MLHRVDGWQDERIASGLNARRNRRNCHHLAPFTEPVAASTRAWCTHARVTEKPVHVPRTRTGTRTLRRIETRTSLLTLTREWERGMYSWPGKRGIHQTSCARERRATFVCTPVAFASAACCSYGPSVCEPRMRCGRNLYSTWLQFYLLHVFVAIRARTVYIKPCCCWHVHATFPFQNRFWCRAVRPGGSVTTTSTLFSDQGCAQSSGRHFWQNTCTSTLYRTQFIRARGCIN